MEYNSVGLEYIKERIETAYVLMQIKNRRNEIRKTALAFGNYNDRMMFVEQLIEKIHNDYFIEGVPEEQRENIIERIAWLQNLLDEMKIYTPEKSDEFKLIRKINTDKSQQNKSIRDYFKYNKANENYITDYLSELKNIFDFTEKLTFGGVCLALFERNLHKNEIRTFSKFMGVLADYWKVELPKDKHKNKYKTKKDELIYKYAILNRELK